MATVANTKLESFAFEDQSASAITRQWLALGQADDGDAFNFIDYADRVVQVTGTFGAGGSINIEGSLDGTTWAVLTDAVGNALTFTSADLAQVLEATPYIRPNVTAGDGTTSLNVYLTVRRG